MASSGIGELVFIDEIMDKIVYLNILKNNLKKSAEKLGLGRDFYFQSDNDPKHTAHIVRMWVVYNVAHTLPTLAQSPDLNPIEHLWAELEIRLRKHHITNKNQLKQLLLEEWNNIQPEFTSKLVHSMPK
ncbi:Transposable element Tc1 transposase [Anthophora plagiata]